MPKLIRFLLTLSAVAAACVFYAQRTVFSMESNSNIHGEDTLSTEDSAALAMRRADSIASYRAYMKSKRYNDSIDAWRKNRMDSIRVENKRKVDSTIAERKRTADSALTERNRINDSLQAAIQLKQTLQTQYLDSLNALRKVTIDSLNAIKKYRSSRQFKDSVSSAQKRVIDSIKAERKVQLDSLIAVRQQQMDSMKIARQQKADSMTIYLDSLRADREKRIDSIKVVHQARMDSLEKVKEQREDEMAQKEKDRKAAKVKKEQDKIKKERSEYSNEQMVKKNWSFLRRIYQNTTTRYNYYFNANNKMREAEDNMYRAKTDNFDSLIALHPFNPNTDSNLLKSDMDSLVQRIGVGIQIHDPRSRWQDDLYLLLGKSFFYKGDFQNAAASFQFIVASALREEAKKAPKKKKGEVQEIVSQEKSGPFHHSPVKNDAILWLARVYTHQQDFAKAQILLDMVNSSKHLSSRLKGELEDAYAGFYLAQGMANQALPYLDSMTFRTDLDKKLRSRSGYLAGQIYQDQQNTAAASRMYTKVLEMHPPIEMDFNASLNNLIVQSTGDNKDKIMHTLERMTKEAKYRTYYDQIYYNLGNVQVANGNTNKALNSLRSSTSYAGSNPEQKGKSFYAMADIYYQTGDFKNAKVAYDSALMFLNQNIADYRTASARATSLSAITVPADKVAEIDSLLRLANMSPKEQSDHVREVLRKIKAAKAAGLITATTGSGTSMAGSGAPGGWYFANESIAGKGEMEFKSKWGNRSLRDNWRRSSGSMSSSGDLGTASDEEDIEEEALTEADLLALIPKDPKVLDSLRKDLESQYYLLGKAFFNGGEYDDALHTYDTLLQLYPDFDKKDEIYYDRYLIALRHNDIAKANDIKVQLINGYPQSARTKTLEAGSTEVSSNNINDEFGINQHLDETYTLLKAGVFKEVIIRYDQVKTLYPVQSSRYMDKYSLMRAVAIAGNGDYGRADSLLTQIIAVNANDSLTNWAKEVHKYIKANLPLASESGITEATGTSLLDPGILSQAYNFNKNEVHFLLVYTKIADGRFMGLRAGITDFNSLKKSDMSLSSSISDLVGSEKVFVIKEFTNSIDAKAYMTELRKEKDLFSGFSNPTDVNISIISEGNYNILMVKKKMDEYLDFYSKNYR